jgi:hypothetical protein
MEYWNTGIFGIMEGWNIGMMEYWDTPTIGIMEWWDEGGFIPILPSFHHSIIPVLHTLEE